MTGPERAATRPTLTAGVRGAKGPWLVLIHGRSCHGGATDIRGRHGLEVHTMEGVGHFPMREDPDTLATLIREIAGRFGAVHV